MAYDALTIDTQTVYANGRHLDRGLVAQLVQYKDGLIQIVLSEVVLRELNSMLVTKAKTTFDSLTKTMREGASNGQLSEDQVKCLQSVLDAIASPEDHARRQLKEFVTTTGAHIVPAEKAAMKDVLESYFKKTPPFSTQGKKDEFPDAISLLALEAWAKEHNKKILAVSKDGDWKAFAALSDWIECIDDLAMAMARLVAAAEAAEKDARAILSLLASYAGADLKQELHLELENAVELESPSVEFSGPMSGESENATLAMTDYEVPSGDGVEIVIVRVRADGFVMRVPIRVKALACVDIQFSIYDSIDHEDVPMGSTSVETEVEFDAFALVDCGRFDIVRDSGKIETEYEIAGAELVGAPSSIDIGYVEYSLSGDDSEFDPQEWNKQD
jgi:PIN domain